MILKAKEILLASYTREAAAADLDKLGQRRTQFLATYGPQVLGPLRGVALLEQVHGTRPKEGLFKELEFALDGFGGVSGYMTKFKIWRPDAGGWKTLLQGKVPEDCSEEEAIRVTERLIDGLCEGLALADQLSLDKGRRVDWADFQRRITQGQDLARGTGAYLGVLDLGWAHKYAVLVRPDLFSFHHAPYQLAGHLIRLGLLPEEGRYLLDWQWRDLRLSDPDLSGLDPVLLMWAAYDEAGFGYGVSYWRVGTDVGTRPGETQVDCWPAMRQGGYAGVGWSSIGDLRSLLAGLSGDAAKARLREVLAQLQSYEPSVLTKSVNQLYSFYAEMKPGDRIAAMKGQRLLGVGRVQGDYYHEFENPQPHRRTVEWLIYPEEPWRDSPGLRTSVYNLTARYPQATLKIEQLVAGREPPRPLSPPPAAATPLTELESWIRSILVRKGQVILYGPPGTGKTFHARRAAQEIVARELFSGRSWAQLCPEEQQQVEGRMTFCTFHPAYAYEEFIEGYRPVITERGPSYVREDGLFLKACARARAEAGCPHVLILDEINRGNVAAVMGELITLLEADKRETLKVRLPLSGAELTVPRNLWIIGTMNTADRSISLLDAALRRRFGFIELMPEPERLDTYVDRLHLSALLTALNRRIREHVPRNARELQVGHAYFMRDGQPLRTKLELLEIFRDDVIPLLAEYCFESYTTLQEILGEDLVDVEKQVVRREALRDPERLHRCLLSLLSLDPEGWVEGDEATVDISLGVTADEDQGLTGASDSGEENAA